ncbi:MULTISPECIES: Sec-independent protein translocase protein TatB [Methylobacillus]|uniref:Sec-independent protein translocase protein TatB n=1 Tax=Methylobacillus flagellatus (strain ATCC 51484 / DSM 6875 / VKM B-1610 / KT) TaxID=265072 RepID=Q1H4Q7_METFK|nr:MULTISPECIES: Sec-independent protein translocase protein TatB [Methylobacillus]ABE48530.1 Sec-independent protein translocase TatB [Methylobacillus flagellatus KT]MPS49188.1 twin-arginine translocase subunit TatB [Methylobacillus sp.]
MFDIAFSELVVIGIVALVVIGPEKLPKVARTVGLLLGRAQRYVNNVKSDISRELRFDELQRLQADMRDAESALKQTGASIEQDIQRIASPDNEGTESTVPRSDSSTTDDGSQERGRPD